VHFEVQFFMHRDKVTQVVTCDGSFFMDIKFQFMCVDKF